MMEHDYEVSFVLEKDINNNEDSMALKPYYNINYEKANLNPKYRFDTFVVGSNNKFAHSASLAVAAYCKIYLTNHILFLWFV